MGKLLGLGVLYLIAAYFFFWWPFNAGSLPLSRYDDVDVNAYFYFPGGREAYLGRMRGASACGSAAKSYAQQHDVSGSSWGYVCCTVRKGSDCYEKIR